MTPDGAIIPTVSPGRKAGGRTRSGWAKTIIEKDYLKRKMRRDRGSLGDHRGAIRSPTLRFAFRRERVPAQAISPCLIESRQLRKRTIPYRMTEFRPLHARKSERQSCAR